MTILDCSSMISKYISLCTFSDTELRRDQEIERIIF